MLVEMKEELYNCLSMIPAIPYSLYVSYKYFNTYSYSFISPLWYACFCCVSTSYHYITYQYKNINHLWLRMDLISQLIMCILTVLHTSNLSYIIVPFIVTMISIHPYLQLDIKHHRYIAYGMNGISIFLSNGPYPTILFHWFMSFTIFGIGFLYPNNFTHSLFHFYNHVNMNMVWNTFKDIHINYHNNNE